MLLLPNYLRYINDVLRQVVGMDSLHNLDLSREGEAALPVEYLERGDVSGRIIKGDGRRNSRGRRGFGIFDNGHLDGGGNGTNSAK